MILASNWYSQTKSQLRVNWDQSQALLLATRGFLVQNTFAWNRSHSHSTYGHQNSVQIFFFTLWNSIHYSIFLCYGNICLNYNANMTFNDFLNWNMTYRDQLETILLFQIGLRQLRSSLNFETESEKQSCLYFSVNTNSVWTRIYSQSWD